MDGAGLTKEDRTQIAILSYQIHLREYIDMRQANMEHRAQSQENHGDIFCSVCHVMCIAEMYSSELYTQGGLWSGKCQ
jgi:hypothetical protein